MEDGWTSRPGCFTPGEGSLVLIVQETVWAGLDGCGKYAVGHREVKCRDVKLISTMAQKSAVLSYTSVTPTETHVWPCWCALMSIVRMKQVLSHADDNLIARLVILLSLFIFIKTTDRDRCWKGSPEMGHLHEERVYYFKFAWSGFTRSLESANDCICLPCFYTLCCGLC